MYSHERVRAPPSLRVLKEERADTDILRIAMTSLVNQGVNGMDLIETFIARRIQPLQQRSHPMWMYTGPGDPTRVHPEEYSEDAVKEKIMWISSARDNPCGARIVQPCSKERPPIEVCVFVYSIRMLSEFNVLSSPEWK